jgi:simple sugar transport system permease protein
MAVGEKATLLWEALRNTLFTGFGLGYTLFYTTPLIFTGLSVALAWHCGLFNIGAEGQLYVGAIAVVLMAVAFPGLHWSVAMPLACLASFCAGGIWGGIAGFLRAKRGSHEVIVTILLNFIAYALVDYLILYPFKNPDTQNTETLVVGAAYQLPTLDRLGLGIFATTPVNVSLLLSIAVAVCCYYFLFRTTLGFELRTVGKNAVASRFAGISVARNTFMALFLGGGLAGLVGVNEVMGHEHKVVQSFSPQYGFTGIAVALIARNHPIGVIFSALLFGALQNSARELEFLSDKLTKELSLVLQGSLIAFVASQYLLEKLWGRLGRQEKADV